MARPRIQRSLRLYKEAFLRRANVDWLTACRAAERYLPAVTEFLPTVADEMRGIADGAGVEFADILALNARTEIISQARVEAHLGPLRTDGCTAVAVPSPGAASGHTLLAQNWDWIAGSVDTVIVLEVERDDGPSYATVVEAGLLAKVALNDAGLGVATNFLLTAADPGLSGLPYHTTLRAILDAETVSHARSMLREMTRASSANYLLADASGAALDIEGAPGGHEVLEEHHSEDGLLTHANHFRASRADDLGPTVAPCSPSREQRLRELLLASPKPVTFDNLQLALSDHAGFPASICYHAAPGLDPIEQDVTAASVIMDVTQRSMAVARGNPCTATYLRHDYGLRFVAPVARCAAP